MQDDYWHRSFSVSSSSASVLGINLITVNFCYSCGILFYGKSLFCILEFWVYGKSLLDFDDGLSLRFVCCCEVCFTSSNTNYVWVNILSVSSSKFLCYTFITFRFQFKSLLLKILWGYHWLQIHLYIWYFNSNKHLLSCSALRSASFLTMNQANFKVHGRK